MTTYTLLGNTIRAARAALGKGAERNVHFKVTKHEDDTFSWSPVEDAPPVPATAAVVPKPPRVHKAKAAAAPVAAKPAKEPRKAKTPKAPKAKRIRVSIIDQPANQEILKLMRRKNGVSAAEVAALGKMTETSYRGLASQMRRVIKIEDIIVAGKPRRHHWDGHSMAAG